MADLLAPIRAAGSAVKSFFLGAPAAVGGADLATSDDVAWPELTPDEYQKCRKILQKADDQSKSDKTKYDKFVKQYRDGILATDANTSADWVKANQVFPYVNVLLSLLYHQNPDVSVTPRLESGALQNAVQALAQLMKRTPVQIRKMYAETLENVLMYAYEEGMSELQNNACLFEALTRGLGWTVTSFDPIRGVSRSDALRRDEVFVDPHARMDPHQGNYIVQICVEDLDAAKDKFREQARPNAAGELTYYPAPDFDPEKVEANYQLVNDEGLTGEKAKKNDPAVSKDCYRYFQKWTKSGAERWVDYFDGITKKHLFRTPWPFKLDYDEFPYEALSFNKQFTQVCDAFPDLQVVESLWRLYEYLVEYFHRHVKRSIAKKILYDRAVFTEEDIEALEDPTDMRFVGCQKLEERSVEEVLKVVDFNSGTDTAAELAKAVKQIAEAILGLDEIQKGGIQAQKEITATHAEILDEYGRLRLGRRQKLVDEWLGRQCRHRAQIERQLTSKEKVLLIAGTDSAEIWETMSRDPADLIGEYSIGIVAGSAGERAKRAKVQMMDAIGGRMATVNQQLGYPAFDMLAWTRDTIRAEGEKKPEQYELPKPPPAPPKAETPFSVNGAAVDGLYKLIAPGSGAPPLANWDEARKVAAEALGVSPQEFTQQMAAQAMGLLQPPPAPAGAMPNEPAAAGADVQPMPVR